MPILAVLALVLTVLLLAGCSSKQPDISVEATRLDFGSVVNGDIVSRDLSVSNDGEADLVIDSIITSCTCTQATVTPLTIPAGQSGVLHIEFDSGFHGPDLNGHLIRQVFVNSNDQRRPELQIELSVFVDTRAS